MFKRFLRPQTLIIVVAGLSLVSVGTVFFFQSQKPAETYVHPTSGDITEQVQVTGTVKAATAVDLSFEIGGTIANVQGPVGTHVAAGTPLATLSQSTLGAQLEQAQAALQVQQAKLDGLKAGTRAEDISVAQTAVAGAQAAVLQAKETLIQAARDGFVKADDAIHNKVDQFFTNPRSANPILAYSVSDSSLSADVMSQRSSMEPRLTDWETTVNTLPTGATLSDPAGVASGARANLQATSDYLTLVAQALTDAVPTTNQPLATIQKYQGDITAARANISAALSAVNAAATQESTAEAALATAQSQLARAKAPALPTDIQAQQAQVAVAQANVDAANAQLAKTVLRAPISGVVTRNDAHVGETAAPGVATISMDSDAQFQIESFVSEADVAKIKKTDAADVRLDAYTGDTFAAHVVAVDPASTVQNGIAGYKVTLQFDTPDPRIKTGLTGNIAITTQQKTGVLRIPQNAIVKRGDQEFVMRKGTNGDELAPVQTGVLSTDGLVEITSGLTASDQIKSFGNN